MPTPTSPAAEDWIPRRDAAQLADCSADTIERDIAAHGLETRTGPNGKVLVNVADLIRIGRIRPDAVGDAASGSVAAELRRAQARIAELAAAAARDAGRLEERIAHYEALRTQLAEKDRQIARLNAIVERLVAALPTGNPA